MPTVHHARREIHCKVVYYGPGLGGKTTNLELIHAKSRPDRRGKLLSLAGESERTLFFDLLPLEIGEFKGYNIRLFLCTVPGQIAHDRTRQTVLRGVDGVVFVVDSQRARIEENTESIANLAQNLRLQGDDPDTMPLVVQYNKRDLPEIATTEELRAALRVPVDVPQVEAVATTGVGVFETLKAATRLCLGLVGDPRRAPEGRVASVLPKKRESMYPVHAVGETALPPAPRMPSTVVPRPSAPLVPPPTGTVRRDG